ncbi:MarR family winged helix-turn-helix transcriptional regulator [Curtobacterium sp. Leaf261]|uniref:MarR family winged helix-turn-helix transcriptional regulator n=1 Tax=Curtobacterium sp. Leaf261 TaxID=1736311 RepID=UPI000B09658F|nr:MarR family winged helix-turn-helix transcriptional regulator [Curtobacterium sp. Leaf261]
MATESSPVDEMVCFSLYAASRATTQAYRALLAPWNLTYPQYLVLVLLWSDGPLTVGTLGDRLDLDSGTLSPLLRRMDEAGIVTRTRSIEDERVVTVDVTDHGRTLRAELAHVPACIAGGTQLGSLDEARELIDTLHRLTAGMQATTADAR